MTVQPVIHPAAHTLAAFSSSQLDDVTAEEVSIHLDTCAECRQVVANIGCDSFLDRLRHPNIVTAYAALQVGGRPVFAMEYVEGEDLARRVTVRGPLSVANACDYARQAALGLQHAFDKGMVHRDIKPHNLILARDG